MEAILYPIYSWQGIWPHVHGLSSNQMPTFFSAVVHTYMYIKYLVYVWYINKRKQESVLKDTKLEIHFYLM